MIWLGLTYVRPHVVLLWSQVRRCEHLTSCLLGNLPLLGCEGFLEDRTLVRPPRDCVKMALGGPGGSSCSALGQAYFCLCVDVKGPSRHSERVQRDGVHREVNGDVMGCLDCSCWMSHV